MEEEAQLILNGIIQAIANEFDRAVAKHPKFPQDIIHMVAVVTEESGEAMRAALNLTYEDHDIKEVEKELIHTAATCIRVLYGIKSEQYLAINQQ